MEIVKTMKENKGDYVENNPKQQNPFTFDRKEADDNRRRRRGRVVIRNISFKASEEQLKKHFEQFGPITDLNLLKKPDGQLVGCAFVQFEKVNDAAKAILKATKHPFLGRLVYVDWAVGKNEYIKRKAVNLTTRECEPEQDIDVKQESAELNFYKRQVYVKDQSDDNDGKIKESDPKKKSEENEDSEYELDGEAEMMSQEVCSDNDMKEKDDEHKEKHTFRKINEKVPLRTSNDINEGCTVFIKNVPFDASSDCLRKCCSKFGPVYYAMINTDPISGHSKGTGFVKFKTKDSADLCMASGEEFVLMGAVLEALPALSREDIRDRKNAAKQQDFNDTRNLYLVKEGLIMTGSKAADGVSASDMNRRHKLEQTKAQILKNLNRFVSRNRLSIHNLPLHYDDEKLRKIIIKFTGFKPHECRVMRENKTSPAYPQGKPKGFGFISFKTHKDALSALRKLNNNPNVFSVAARPIVGFSIEDRSVHKIKLRRNQKALENNPNYIKKKEKQIAKKVKKNAAKEQIFDNHDNGKKKAQKNINDQSILTKAKHSADNEQTDDVDMEKFVGIASKPGTTLRMRSNRKIRDQAEKHKKRLSEQKRKEKKRKQQLLHRTERKHIERPKQGKNKKSDKDHFTKLVSKYKQMLNKTEQSANRSKVGKRTKWYAE